MATYMDVERVQYEAASGIKAPICKLYFCRHCLKVRSGDCVSHEVDSHYCPNCLENMPSAEAKLKKNRCANCFDCPSCNHSLSTRATTVGVPDADQSGKATPKKVYYLACSFCRWTSRDVGIRDQPVASGGWQEKENGDTKRIATLLEYYKQLAAKEKAEKEKKKYIRRRSYLHYSQTSLEKKPSGSKVDKYGLGSIASRRRSGMLGVGSLRYAELGHLMTYSIGPSIMRWEEDEDLKLMEIDGAVASEDVEELPEDVYTTPVSLAKVTSIGQRLSDPEFQTAETSDMYPRHKRMLIKRSLRCKECEHNLSKHEFNPASIKFKIQLVALHLVPEIRIMTLPNLVLNQESQVILTLLNPLDNLAHVTLLPQEQPDGWSNAKVGLPPCELLMSPRDDAAEFDDGLSDHAKDFNDHPSVVVFRKSNKIGFFISVTPSLPDEDVKVSLIMKYDYKNVTTALTQMDNKEPETVWLHQKIFLNLGRLTA